MKKIIGLLVLIAILVAAIVIYTQLRNTEKKSVNYAFIPSALIDAPSAISIEELSKKGVNPKPFSTGIETVQALIGGATDVATLAEWPFILSSLKKDDLRIVAMICSAKSMGMVANKENGINSLNDLSGKKVGFPQGTSAQFVYESIIKSVGLEDQVNTVNLAPPNLPPSMKRDDIDAMVVWQPFLEKMVQEDPNKFHFIAGSENFLKVLYFVVTTESYIKENPEGIKDILNVLVQSSKKLKARDAESLELLSKKTNLNKETLNKLLPLFEYEVKIDKSIISAFETLSVWAKSSGITDKNVSEIDWNKFIHTETLKGIEPANVEL